MTNDRAGELDDGPASTSFALALAEDERQAVDQAASSAHDDQGVDLTLIDWMLDLTPTERLEVLRRHAAGLAQFVTDDARR